MLFSLDVFTLTGIFNAVTFNMSKTFCNIKLATKTLCITHTSMTAEVKLTLAQFAMTFISLMTMIAFIDMNGDRRISNAALMFYAST